MQPLAKFFKNMKVTNLFWTNNIIKSIQPVIPGVIKRHCSSEENKDNSGEVKVERLKTRSVLCVEGTDSLDFLQELTTNDVKVLEETGNCIFTAFLNAKGKVIHDTIIYKPEKKNQFLVECDISSIGALQVHMTMYRGRRKVEVRSVENEMNVWAIYSPNEETISEIDLGENVIVCTDPRVTYLGLRVLAPVEMDIAKKLSIQGVYSSSLSLYKSLRYKLGIGEGTMEIPYGRYSPTEVNCDYLNGICLKKNSYIGQEAALKQERDAKYKSRLMPIFLDLLKINYLPLNTPIEDVKRKKKTPVGYLRGNQGGVGIGLMKVSEALQEGSVRIGKVLGHCVKPPWWPQDSTAHNISNK